MIGTSISFYFFKTGIIADPIPEATSDWQYLANASKQHRTWPKSLAIKRGWEIPRNWRIEWENSRTLSGGLSGSDWWHRRVHLGPAIGWLDRRQSGTPPVTRDVFGLQSHRTSSIRYIPHKTLVVVVVNQLSKLNPSKSPLTPTLLFGNVPMS